jgi:hypothetical protein
LDRQISEFLGEKSRILGPYPHPLTAKKCSCSLRWQWNRRPRRGLDLTYFGTGSLKKRSTIDPREIGFKSKFTVEDDAHAEQQAELEAAVQRRHTD